uniref:Uncharacterized protein n=1 Tax=Ananas comosus var. bracteatus TaxID=296719 RepID=A0A6V7P1M6_ANACO|nr:unnamed protein product [Ananas comosus var. bracteatus]
MNCTFPHQENPAYARCRDKLFSAYKNIEFLTENTTASGGYAFTTAVETANTIESSSGSACNISPCPFKLGSSGYARNANDDGTNTSRSPSPPVMRTTGVNTASGSGHSSGGNRARSPEPSKKQPQHASTSGGRKKKNDPRPSAMAEMVELGKHKLELVRQLCHTEMSSRLNIPSIEACMQRVYGMTRLSNEQILAAGDAFKEDKNRQLFMTLKDDLAFMWAERQLEHQNVLYNA